MASQLGLVVACGSDTMDPPPPPSPVEETAVNAIASITVSDDSDRGNASDVTITFGHAAPDETGVKEYWVAILPAVEAAGVLPSDANSLPGDRFFVVGRGGAPDGVNPPEGLRDGLGDAIVDGVEYRVLVLSVPDSTAGTLSALSAPSPSITLGPAEAAVAGTPLIDDADNLQNGRDVTVSFDVPVGAITVGEYRIVLLKEAAAPLFAAEDLGSLAPSSSLGLAVGPASFSVTLDATTTDSDGDPIAEGIAYKAVVVSVPDGVFASLPSVSSVSNTVTLGANNIVRTLVASIGASGGVAVDSAGDIFVSDYGTAAPSPNGTQVFRVTPTGTVSEFANGLSGASGNEIDAAGNFYQSNIASGVVTRFGVDGSRTDVATGLTSPTGLGFDSSGNLLINQCGGATLRLDPAGQTIGTISSPAFNCPNGIAVDESDNVYICSFNNGSLIKAAPDGTTSTLASIPGGVCGHLVYDGNGSLYVAAYSAQQIYRISVGTGITTLIAGTGTRGQRDGSAVNAELSLPNGLALSPDGTRLYFNDSVSTTGTTVKPNSLKYVELVSKN